MTEKLNLNSSNFILSIRNISKSYNKRPVIRDISMNLNCKEVVGLLGPNGAGKTTSFHIISGLIRPDSGGIYLNEYDITKLPMYKRARIGIGYLPQESSIFKGLTVEKNIMAILEIVEDDIDKRQYLLEELLNEFSITHLRKTGAIYLSGGERRRVEIARALASRPKFMLLDEPLAGIDPIAIIDLRNLIYHLKDRGIGVLITDHNVREALEIIDRAYIINDGVVLMEGTPQEIVNNSNVRKVYLGESFNSSMTNNLIE